MADLTAESAERAAEGIGRFLKTLDGVVALREVLGDLGKVLGTLKEAEVSLAAKREEIKAAQSAIAKAQHVAEEIVAKARSDSAELVREAKGFEAAAKKNFDMVSDKIIEHSDKVSRDTEALTRQALALVEREKEVAGLFEKLNVRVAELNERETAFDAKAKRLAAVIEGE